MNIKERIKFRLDELEACLKEGKHLISEGEAQDLIVSIAKFSSLLSDAERDFINAAKMAVADKKPWK
jgi:hypothetical protein